MRSINWGSKNLFAQMAVTVHLPLQSPMLFDRRADYLHVASWLRPLTKTYRVLRDAVGLVVQSATLFP